MGWLVINSFLSWALFDMILSRIIKDLENIHISLYLKDDNTIRALDINL